MAECRNLASNIFGFFYEGLGEGLMHRGWMSCRYRVSLEWELATRLLAEWVGHRRVGLLGTDGLRGGTGLGECEAFMPSKKFVNRLRSSAHLGRTAGAGLHGAGFGT